MNRYLLSLAMLGGLFFGSDASAAWELNCSDGTGTIKYSRAAAGQVVTWTEPQVTDQGVTVYVPVRRRFSPPDIEDIEVTFEELQELDKGDETGCGIEEETRIWRGREGSWISGWRDSLGRITIVKKDGSTFPEGSTNLSPDGKIISAHLICTSSYYYGWESCNTVSK